MRAALIAPVEHWEFNLPDEDRTIEASKLKRCACGNQPRIYRRWAGAYQEFQVKCLWVRPTRFLPLVTHTDPTPWLRSSQSAIAHWNLVVALTQ